MLLVPLRLHISVDLSRILIYINVHINCLNADLPEEARFRRCVVKSVIDSELNYIHSLRRIIDDYEGPLADGIVISRNKVSHMKLTTVLHV